MGKRFGLSENLGDGWFPSQYYDKKLADKMDDPAGGTASNIPTAIPSPFARFDLVRKAFRNIRSSENLSFLEKKTKVIVSREDERLVSRALDLAELLFQFDKYSSVLEIKRWDIKAAIKSLTESKREGHRKLGDVFKLFIQQDNKSFNFYLETDIYLLYFNKKLIGSTSPVTMFCSAATGLEEVSIRSNDGQEFFREAKPLYKRDPDFQNYLYSSFTADSKWYEFLPELRDYVLESAKLARKAGLELDGTGRSLNASDLEFDGGQRLMILGEVYKKYDAQQLISKATESDFLVAATNPGAEPALALQNDYDGKEKYVTAEWQRGTFVPPADSRPLSERTLPGNDIRFPYLTVDDFLERTLIKLVYPIAKDYYFDGNVTENSTTKVGYLLPLKPLFFKYFKAKDLYEKGAGTPELSMEKNKFGEGMAVTLKVPIRSGRYITFTRHYSTDKPTLAAGPEQAYINEKQFGLDIFPFVAFPDNTKAVYNIQLVDTEIIGQGLAHKIKISAYDNGARRIEVAREHERIAKAHAQTGTTYYQFNKNIEFLQVVAAPGEQGIVVPKWQKPPSSGKQYTFSVDFGTTNTHIEYKEGANPPKAFDISDRDRQAIALQEDLPGDDGRERNLTRVTAIDIETKVINEFIPALIGTSNYKFPLRTVIAESLGNTEATSRTALVGYNIPFAFQLASDVQSAFTTDLKWGTFGEKRREKVKAFLEELVLMIRAKVLLNGGDLNKTKIVWTYPNALPTHSRNNLRALWEDLCTEYLKKEASKSLSEAIAPFQFFSASGKLTSLGQGVNVMIDIGGGTSDVLIYKNKAEDAIFSYRFAGNTLFGEGYYEQREITENWLVKRYKDDFFEKLESAKDPGVKAIAEERFKSGNAVDFANFLFSLATNKATRDDPGLDLNKRLGQDYNVKMVFLYFFAAKIYHVATVLNETLKEYPENTLFSGNGSKILRMITPDMSLLSEYATEIFKEVLTGQGAPQKIKVICEEQYPKEATAKGACYLGSRQEDVEIRDLDSITRAFNRMPNGRMGVVKEGELRDVKQGTIDDVQTFHNLFIRLGQQFNYDKKFGIPLQFLSAFNEIERRHLEAWLQEGLDLRSKLAGGHLQSDAEVEESLFFYPLVQVIQKLYEFLPANSEIID